MIICKDVGPEYTLKEGRIGMYAQLVTFVLGTGMRGQAEKMADD